LHGVRIVELGGEIAAGYATKLLADLGADVIKVEPPTGDPLRAWGPFPGDVVDGERSGLFRALNAGKRSIVAVDADSSAVWELLEAADAVVESLGPGGLEDRGLAPEQLVARNRELALVRIAPFGQVGPAREVPVTDLTLQAMGGWVSAHGLPGRRPVQFGGRLSEYTVAAFAAAATLTAIWAARDTAAAVTVDLSMLECLVGTLAYPMLFNESLRALGLPPPDQRHATLPGIVRCRDGWVGINCLTGQHWQDVCAMAGLDEFAGRQTELGWGGPELEKFYARLQPWLDEHTGEEIVELSQAFRIPAAPVGDGRSLLSCAQFSQREFFEAEAGAEAEGGSPLPGPPWRLGRTPAHRHGPPPPLDVTTHPSFPATRAESASDSARATAGQRTPRAEVGAFGAELAARPAESAGDSARGARGEGYLPFAGLRVLDLGTFWAGPYAGMYLGALGADVIKLESVQRPDGFRFSGAFPQEGDDYYDRSGIWQATNLDKRDLTLDLTRPEGRELLERLVPRADVVIENFSARVVDQFGLGYERLRALRPEIVMVRMPGFGLEGPWRDYVGWAMGIEQASGMCAVTGEPDRPMNPGGFLDPVIGMHAAVAIQAALEHRRRTGEGQMIEIAQLEVGANLTVEQVIDWSLNRRLAHREGNRDRRCAPQGVYPCAPGTGGSGAADLPPPGDWVAISVRDDADWDGLVRALDEPDWARAPELAHADGRRAHHDAVDDHLARWTASWPADEVVARLRVHGVPVARQVRVDRLYDQPQLIARDYYQALDALKTGTRRYPGWPMQFSFLDRPHRFGPPSLGQHNREILHGELGLDDDTLRRLEAEHIIGDRLAH
jgi:crotonobetainyl-CoA:carnitine CoA-transferase CaiB-like acyl-CoA transferase